MAASTQRSVRFVHAAIDGPLDQSQSTSAVNGLTIAQNVVYRRFGSRAKRTGTAPDVGSGTVPGNMPVRSGVRWNRGKPSALSQMIVQSGDALYLRNDVTGAYTLIGTLAANSTPAFFASAYDPAQSGVGGTPASDVLIIAYGSGPPMKWDGTNFTQLSTTITASYTGCTDWHEHVWFWGDTLNPDTLYATDLGNPEGFTFMTSLPLGGYQIGRGDGDTTIQTAQKWGSRLAIFKSRSMYQITGFDFYAGEYQFQVTPLVTGIGTNSPHGVAVLRNALMWWSGQTFYRLAPGQEEPQPMGVPIINSVAQAAIGVQKAARAVAGDFLVQTISGRASYNNVFLCALDMGTGKADTVFVYDDDASQFFQKPAWTLWTGFTVGSWIAWGGQGDQKLLYIGDAAIGQVNLLGQNATADTNAPIATQLQSGRMSSQTPDVVKRLNLAWLEVESNTATFNLQVTGSSAIGNTQAPIAVGVGSLYGTAVFGTSVFSPSIATQYQAPSAKVDPEIAGTSHTILITETSATSSWEIIGLTYRVQEEAFNPS